MVFIMSTSGAGHRPSSSTADRQNAEHDELAAIQVLSAATLSLATSP